MPGFRLYEIFLARPGSAPTLDEYFALLEKENVNVRKGLDAISNPEDRKYYEKMTDRMYTWSKNPPSYGPRIRTRQTAT